MKAVLDILKKEKAVVRAKELLAKFISCGFSGCNLIQKSVLISLLSRRQNLIVTATESAAYSLYETIQSFTDEVRFFPSKDLFFDHLSIKSETNHNLRLQALALLSENKSGILVLSVTALIDKYIRPESLSGMELRISASDSIDRDKIEEKLSRLGYERVSITELTGQYSIRGSLIDIYPVNYDHPVRIDLWGNEIERMSFYDEISQVSTENIESIRIIPTGNADSFNEEKGMASLLDYLGEDSLVFWDEPNAIKESIDELYQNELLSSQDVFSKKELNEKLASYLSVSLALLRDSLICKEEVLEIRTVKLSGFKARLPEFFDAVKEYIEKGYLVTVFINNEKKAKRLVRDINEHGISAYYSEDKSIGPKIGEAVFYSHYLSEGIAYPELGLVIITDNDIFGRRVRRKKERRYKGEVIENFFDLNPEDLVVHEDYGLGRYLGIEKLNSDGSMKDYLKIEYAKNSLLYIPVAQMDRIQKYISKDNVQGHIKLNRLDNRDWERTKANVKKNVEEVAGRLIELYALRKEKTGFAFREDSIWQNEFEDSFIYEETPAQLSTLAQVKADMESTKVMDRLICGDVGFGKTEIAIRAAFKAVQDGKQVAYLVPTTVLAMQHFKTFSERLADYPVRVDLLCRFRTPSLQRQSIAGIKSGAVDIIVGTHRLLSKDVGFKDLGLLIVDEEQRFGVSDKEKIKELKQDVDVLTLTATPIPRTLHMSMIGVRDISILNDPPSNRLPVNTYAAAYDEELIVTAVRRELARGGQVFFVYNRVNTIADVTFKLNQLLPGVEIAYAHGQMSAGELERIMYDFGNGEIDVLVSTTIIETGIDMPNVNTMIIADAQRLGLSSLYQLRGRIGRSDKEAYAYLLYPKNTILKEEAQKRLHAIREFSQLGSGYRIAMKDLEIRGEGNIFGFEQSGHIGAVGYELYCKMLKIAIANIKNEDETELLYNTSIEIPVNAYLPNEYIEDERTRIEFYKRIALIDSKETRSKIEAELKDRFGEIPKVSKDLIELSFFKAKAAKVYVTAIKQNGGDLFFELYERARIDVSKIEDSINRYNLELARDKDKDNPKLFTVSALKYRHKYYNTLSFLPKGKPCFVHKIREDDNLYEIIEKVIDVIGLLVLEL